MAAELAGTAAIRLVPSLTGFRSRAQTELQRQKGLSVDVDIRPRVDTSVAQRQLERFRAKEAADAINLRARVDEADFKRSFQRVEHVFQRSAFSKAFRLQIKVVGIDALYLLTGVAGSAAAALDTVAKAAIILPGALAAAGVAAGVFAAALGDVKKAITAVQTEQDQAADKARAFASAQQDSAKAARDVKRAQDDVARSVRSAIRNYEDLAHAVRGTSLDEADALLNVQESYDRLLEGGQKSLTQLRRDQLAYARDLHNLDGVRMQNKRTLEDYNTAQREGIAGSKEVIAALDAVEDAQNRVADAANRMADASQTKTMTGAFSRISPAAQEFVRAVTDADAVWVRFIGRLQEGVFQGQATNLIDTLNTSIANLGPGLDRVASSVGGVFLDLGQILRRNDIQQFLKGIIDGTAGTLDTLRKGLGPLITGFLRMADVGARKLPQLADVFNRLFEQFDRWTEKVAADGSLDRWIDQSIKGVEQLWNSGKNLVLIIGDIANAWRLAGGESTGLIGDLEDLTATIHNWTSGTGMQTMVNTFKNIRDFADRMGTAFSNIWPTVQSIASTVREWSVTFFQILGYALRMTEWVNEHTGLVKFMVAAYLSIRTVKPIWDLLKGAATAYTNVLMRAATLSGPGGAFARNSVQGLATVQTAFGRTGTAAQTMSSAIDDQRRAFGGAFSPANNYTNLLTPMVTRQRAVNTALQGALNPTNDLVRAFRQANPHLTAFNRGVIDAVSPLSRMGTTATTTAAAVGVSRASGLFGAVAGLGAFLGPMALAMAATGGIIWAIDKMGEAHRKAAAEAQNQKNQLDALKSTLDQFTGAFTAQTAIETGKSAQDFQTTAFGKRNILQDITRTGVASPEALIGATNPVNQATRTAIADQLRTGAAQRIAPFLDAEIIQSGGRKTTRRQQYAAVGVSENDIIGALTGDQGAIDKINAAAKAQPGGGAGPDSFASATGLQQQAARQIPPEAWDFLTSLQFLNVTAGSNVSGGAQNQFGTNAAFGQARLKSGAGAAYGTNPEVYFNSPDTAIIVTREPVGPDFVKNFPSDVGTVTLLPGGRAQIQLTREGTLRDVVHFAVGGMIRGVGSGTSDSNLIAASRGEYIVRKQAVDAIGVTNLDRMNSMRFDVGGLVGGIPFPLAPTPVPAPPVPAPVLNTPPAPIAPPPVPSPPPVAPAPYTPTVPGPVAPPAPPTLDPASVPTPFVPATTEMPFSPYANGAPAYNQTLLPPNMGPGPFGPIPVQTDNADDTIASYLTGLARQNGLRVGALSSDPDFNAKFGAGLHDNDGGWHPNKRALDIGNGPDDLALAQWWVQDPARVATTKELILNVPGWDTGLNIKDGKFIRDYGGGVYDQATLNGHSDHMHLALSGVPNSQGAITVGGLPVSYSNYLGGGQGAAGAIPGVPGQGGSFNLGDYIKNMYTEAYKPENVTKFLAGQAENVGSQLLNIGLMFLKGFTGIDASALVSNSQQVAGHFTPNGSGPGGGSTLEAGSPMDNAIAGNIGSFFDPNAGVDLSAAAAAYTNGGDKKVGGTQKEILQYIIKKAESLGYSRQQAIWFATQAFGESHLSPSASNPNGWEGIFQFDQPTWAGAGGGDIHDAKTNIDNYFKLAAQRHLTPESFTDPSQLGTQVSIGGPYHPENAAKGHRTAAELGIMKLLAEGSYASGGLVPARVSRGEYRMSPKAVSHYGVGFMNSINSFAGGGIPFLPQGLVVPPNPSPNGPINIPSQTQAQPPAPPAPRPVGPPSGGVQQVAPAPAPVGPSTGPQIGAAAGTSAGQVPDFNPFVGGLTGQQPIPASMVMPDARTSYQGAAPTTNQHNAPWADAAIKQGWAFAGSLVAQAVQAAAAAGSFGAGGGQAASAASGAIQSGFQMAGVYGAGLLNILSSAGVGTIDGIGTKATPSGAPLLPQNPQMGFGKLPDQSQIGRGATQGGGGGGPLIMNVYNGGIHTQNMDEWQRRQQLLERQQEQPLTNSFVH